MPRPKNPFFQFKQFTVWHDRCAMKVCTEACLLGAYLDLTDAKRVLDIGTGTGLLALMMAQRHPEANIWGVEIDVDAVEQARENVSRSPFSERINLIHRPIQDVAARWQEPLFDLIVSNPPFFNNHLRSADSKRTQALHTDTLSFVELAQAVGQLLSQEGHFVVLLPPHESQLFGEIAAETALFPITQLRIHQQESKPLFRCITTYSKQEKPLVAATMFIHKPDSHSGYSEDFELLLKDFYLAL